MHDHPATATTTEVSDNRGTVREEQVADYEPESDDDRSAAPGAMPWWVPPCSARVWPP